MEAELRLSDWRPAAALIPGLLHFAGDRPMLRPAGRIRRIRLFIPYVAQLRLARCTVKPAAPATLDGAEVRASSSRNPAADPAQLLAGKPFHTAREAHPFWEVRFPEPIAIQYVQISNLLSGGAAEAYGLHVELEDADGRSWRWANSDPAELAKRLTIFRSHADVLMAGCEEAGAAARDLKRFASAIAKICKAAAQAVATGIGPAPAEAQWLRQHAVRAAVILVEGTGADLRAALVRARPVLDALIERRARGRTTIRAFEFEALAMSCTATVLLQGATKRGRAAEDGEYLRTAENVDHVEQLVNRYFLAAGGDPAMTPLIFRKHGLMGPVLLGNVDGHLDAIEAVAAALGEAGHESAICYGTLLGAVREKAFIPHDDDVDIAFPFPARPADALPGLTELAARLTRAGYPTAVLKATLMIKVTDPVTGITVDAFPMFDGADGEVMMAMEQIRLRAVPRASVLPFGRIDFYGRSFAAPAAPETFLADRYGVTWRTPIREFAGGAAVVAD